MLFDRLLRRQVLTVAGAGFAAGVAGTLILRREYQSDARDKNTASGLGSRPLPSQKRGTLVRIPNVVVEDDRSRQLKLFTDIIANRSVCVNFFYTQCNGSCPGTTRILREVRKKIGTLFSPEQLVFLSFSLDPATDSPQRLAEYRRSYGIPSADSLPEWIFCTCPEDELLEVRRAFGVYDPDPAVDQDRTQHAATLTFGNDRTGRWSALPSGIPADQLVNAMCRVMGNTEQQRYAAGLRYRESIGNGG